MTIPFSIRKTQDMIFWICHTYPYCIKFVPNESTIRSISLYVEVNQVDIYGTMTMSYGILFTLAVLEYFISTEEYERCKTIVEGISRLNSLYKCDLPHSLTDKWCMENMELSPLQILEKHYHNQTNK